MKKKLKNTNISIFVMLFLMLLQSSCNDYLDVVPDNVFQYEDLFTSRKQAFNALATVYVMLPGDHRGLTWSLGDEYPFVTPAATASRTLIQGAAIMRGEQSATSPLLSYWTGTNLPSPYNIGMWAAIRECDQFILNVDRIPDMTAEMKADWKAQAKFMKAYYLFMMVQTYGPVIIPDFFDENGGINTEMYQPRRKVEECFDYILNLMNEAILNLQPKRESLYLGQIDQVGAKAIKARVLLHRASPFYNGNEEYYHNFLDHNGEHFFSQTEDREKWKIAADAVQEALDACEQYGFNIYHFKGNPYDFDLDDYKINTDRMQTLYDLRFRITERWNEEIIWGWVRGDQVMSAAALINKTSDEGPAPRNMGGGWANSSYQAMERYYTENGLPIDEDRTVDTNSLHEIVMTPEETDPEYISMRGYMQPNQQTINMYLNREPRFYADLYITGGYARAHMLRIPTMMFQDTEGGFMSLVHNLYYIPSSGIGIQKIIHPEAYHLNVQTIRVYPNPIIRVADLYLMKAEAMNEYYGPSQEVYDAINIIRLRAGIPTVEESYGDASVYVTDEARNKHLTKEGMREIILRERANELAFEFGHRFWDMQRWKRSVSEFSRPMYAWNYQGTTAETFFVMKNIQGRKWGITECLWPIENTELLKNELLIQNPGW